MLRKLTLGGLTSLCIAACASAQAAPLFFDGFDAATPEGWRVSFTANGANLNRTYAGAAGREPVVTYYGDMLDADGHHKPTTATTSPLIAQTDVDGDGVTSGSLLLRVGAKSYESPAQHQGVLLERDFIVPRAGEYTASAAVMAVPYVPYWVNLSGGKFTLLINGDPLDAVETGWIGRQGAPASEYGARREALSGDAALEAGSHVLGLLVTRSMNGDYATPAQLIDDVAIAASSAGSPPQTKPLATPLPPSALMLLGGLAGIMLLRRHGERPRRRG